MCESREGHNLRMDEKRLASLLLTQIINPALLASEFRVKKEETQSFICQNALGEILNKLPTSSNHNTCHDSVSLYWDGCVFLAMTSIVYEQLRSFPRSVA